MCGVHFLRCTDFRELLARQSQHPVVAFGDPLGANAVTMLVQTSLQHFTAVRRRNGDACLSH